jgi:transketolase
MGLYAMWALRNELIRISRPDLLAPVKQQLRLEDLLGFRRNPTNETPFFRDLHCKALDGHPTCATPFVKIATGASGVGIPAAFGLAHAAMDYFGEKAPRVHVLEGEGGMTAGRVHEALAAASTAGLWNVVLHVDWNQASIDSNQVCREEDRRGDYVQWSPHELLYMHDWNVIVVSEMDFQQVLTAQRLALSMENHQPTAIVYRTIKGWKYGIEGSASHGAGHKFNSPEYYNSLHECEEVFNTRFPRHDGDASPTSVESTYFQTLMLLRDLMESDSDMTKFAGQAISEARSRLTQKQRSKRTHAPLLENFYQGDIDPLNPPKELQLKPGSSATTRAVLGDVLRYLNHATGGALIATAADLAGSTSIANAAKGFGEGFYHSINNPTSRLIPVGGICEDAMGAWMAGLSSFGKHIGITASYGAFLAALEHVAARLHGIGQQTRESITGEPYKTWIMVNAHAGVKTGEDGPTHADPQALQLLQECFPGKVMITLTPWDPREIWPLVVKALKLRPAVLAPFVTRPADTLVDRDALRLPPPEAATHGVYALRLANSHARQYHGSIVLQGNGVTTIFVTEVLPQLDREGFNLNVFYVSSAELFELLSPEIKASIYPEQIAMEAFGITDFTLPTMYRWIKSEEGRRRTLHSFAAGRYLGSGSAKKVLEEAGIDATGQLNAIRDYAQSIAKRA